jgi:chromosome segregation ATPase
MGAKTEDKNSMTMSGIEMVHYHIRQLANEASELKESLTKLDADHQDNRIKIASADKEYAKVRFQEEDLNNQMQQIWKIKDSIKTKQRNMVSLSSEMEKIGTNQGSFASNN